jgi:hypothetical protein
LPGVTLHDALGSISERVEGHPFALEGPRESLLTSHTQGREPYAAK